MLCWNVCNKIVSYFYICMFLKYLKLNYLVFLNIFFSNWAVLPNMFRCTEYHYTSTCSLMQTIYIYIGVLVKHLEYHVGLQLTIVCFTVCIAFELKKTSGNIIMFICRPILWYNLKMEKMSRLDNLQYYTRGENCMALKSVLLGLHGNSTEGFFLKNLYCFRV